MMEAEPPGRGAKPAAGLPWEIAAPVLLMALGAVFRLMDLSARNLWTDEAWVALAALKPTASEALAAGQSTPPFYLLFIRALAQVFGGSEAVLRSLSFGFGLGTVVLFWFLARSLTGPAPAIAGLAALAFSPIMVYYSKELKQYSGDAFFAVLLFFLAERLRTAQGQKGWLTLALAGIVGAGFSHSLVFILPVVIAALWLALPAPGRTRLVFVAALWGAAFLALYALFFRHQVDHQLIDYWSKDFPDFSGLPAFLIWLAGAWRRYLNYFLGSYGVFWGAPLLVLGVLHLCRRGPRAACLYLVGPLLLAFFAAALHRYPFMAHYGGSRLMLFSAPMLYLTVAAGVVASCHFLWQRRGWRWLTPVFIVGLLLALKPVEMLQENFSPSFNRSQLKPLAARLERELKPADWVYVYYYAIHPFNYYFQQEARQQIYYGKSCVETGLELPWETAAHGREKMRGEARPQRLWLIGGHYPDLDYMQAFAKNLLGPDWRQAACVKEHGAVLFRFERQETPPANGRTGRPALSLSGSPAPPPETACE
ncbi:MAG: glycosyltransferase family 39 protein [Deltaproteobacteria bacterium]|nr:glycosyltransferase family 39 protein [Desulfitobacteriaceae bacterium]MDI6854793.1 glycosyltransferase family 39 protein [Deltaproteobacteria bacterium]